MKKLFSRKWALLPAVVLSVVGVLYFCGVFDSKKVISSSSGSAANIVEQGREKEPVREVIVLSIAEGLTENLHSEEADGQADLELLQHLLYSYRQTMGSNPGGGENMLIVEDLRGANSRKMSFLPESVPFLNENGELVDRWGTPYHFHPLSGEEMEIVSAGPDTELWTDDDLKL